MALRMISTSVLAVVVLLGGSALAQQSAPPKVNCHANPRQKVEGQVVKIDAATNVITVKESDGSVHEFKASRETLQDLKAGDRIDARLRPAENC
jgi:ribosomal protein S1